MTLMKTVQVAKGLQYQSTNLSNRQNSSIKLIESWENGEKLREHIMKPEEESTIPHVTRHDGTKTVIYVVIGLTIAAVLIIGTIWLLLAN